MTKFRNHVFPVFVLRFLFLLRENIAMQLEIILLPYVFGIRTSILLIMMYF